LKCKKKEKKIMLSISIPAVVSKVNFREGRYYVDFSMMGGNVNMLVDQKIGPRLKEFQPCTGLFEVKLLSIVRYNRVQTVLEFVRLLEVKAGQGDGQ
jgi:hypothetical protein